MANILKSAIPYTQPETENLILLIKNSLRRNSNHTIFTSVTTGNRWTGRELELVISRIADFLINECNFKKGDVCTILSEDNDFACIAILAVACVGGVANMINYKSTASMLHDTASVIDSKFLITSHNLLEPLIKDIRELASKLCIITYDKLRESSESNWKSICDIFSKDSHKEGISLDKLCEMIPIDAENDYAIYQFSSGTTGKPKPIPRTHKNLCHLVASVNHEELMDMKPGVVLAGSLSLTHRPGLWAILTSVVHGSELVIWADCATSAEKSLQTVEKYKVTILALSLPTLTLMASRGVTIKDNYDLSSLEQFTVSGAKIVNADLPATLVKEFKVKSVRQCFGMTESGWVFLIEKSKSIDNYMTVGHVVPGTEAMVVDRDTLRPLEANKSGEIVLRGPQIFPGYLTDKRGVLNRSDFTEDGWFRIGDRGYYDENGLFYIEGRYKEFMILSNNRRFFPNEIEAVISQHPAIEAVCVVKTAKGQKEYYDVARAFVSLRPGFTLTEDELVSFAQRKNSFIILGGGLRIIDNFPRLQNGKFDRQTLANMD